MYAFNCVLCCEVFIFFFEPSWFVFVVRTLLSFQIYVRYVFTIIRSVEWHPSVYYFICMVGLAYFLFRWFFLDIFYLGLSLLFLLIFLLFLTYLLHIWLYVDQNLWAFHFLWRHYLLYNLIFLYMKNFIERRYSYSTFIYVVFNSCTLIFVVSFSISASKILFCNLGI